MAAFIQKFFKGRKTPEKPVAPTQGPEQPKQDHLLEQQQLLDGSPTIDDLEKLAIEGKTADLRLQAATAVRDHSALQRLQKASRGRDKGVYQVVRQKLQGIREAEAERQRQSDRVQAALQQAEEHAKTDNTQLYEARLDNLLKQWKTVETFATADQTTTFLNSVHQCRERIRQVREKEEAEEVQRGKADERAQTLQILESTLDDLKAQPEDRLPSLSSLDALQKTQENRWLEATRHTEVAKTEQKTYETLMQALRHFIGAVQRLQHHSAAIAELLDHRADADHSAPDQDQCLALVKGIDWPAGYTLPADLSKLVTMAGEQKPKAKASAKTDDQKQQKEVLGATLDDLETALEARQLKESRQHFKHAQQQLHALDDRNARGFQARLQLLSGQLRELQDWQGFATQPKQIALCERMEHLAEQHMEPETKAGKIKELQNEWRELGGSSDRELWQRFKKASDLAYEPCKDYFSAKSGLKKANLEKRQEICEQLALFVAQTDWSTVDWKAVEHIDRVAKDEWKSAWPVEFRDNRAVQKRFDELLGQLEQPLNAERERNEALKQAIVEKAQTLIEHEPLTEAMNQAKALQAEWKAIGLTRHRQDRKLWQAFRTACDAVFARRDAQKHEQEAQNLEAANRLNAVLEKSTEITDSADEEALKMLSAELKAMASEPLSGPMKEQLRAEQQRLHSLQQQKAQAEKLRDWQQHIQQRIHNELETQSCPKTWSQRAENLPAMTTRELVIRAEILATRPSPDEDQALRMEIQVQRLADGMTGNNTTIDINDELETLVAGWCLGTLSEERTDALAQRLLATLEDSLS